MRDAIRRAELGDDVYGEDPTTNELESYAAELLGKEAAMFVPSGTMANLIALMSHCPRGRKILAGNRSDIWRWEAGGAAVLGGLVYHPVRTQSDGELALEDLEDAIGGDDDPQCAVTGLICLETTHCLCGGKALSLRYLKRVRQFAEAYNLPIHIDGARLFNAAVAMEVEAHEIAAFADTVSVCLSKGLAAPVGSILAGPREFVFEARRLRKMLGGGMRQSGVLGAAGLYALKYMIPRLAEDHIHAKLLASGLREMPGVLIDAELPQSNIVFWRLMESSIRTSDFVSALEREGVRVLELEKDCIRAVTHYGIRSEDVELALQAIRRALVQFRTEKHMAHGPSGRPQ
jgi:threonine aldolase